MLPMNSRSMAAPQNAFGSHALEGLISAFQYHFWQYAACSAAAGSCHVKDWPPALAGAEDAMQVRKLRISVLARQQSTEHMGSKSCGGLGC